MKRLAAALCVFIFVLVCMSVCKTGRWPKTALVADVKNEFIVVVQEVRVVDFSGPAARALSEERQGWNYNRYRKLKATIFFVVKRESQSIVASPQNISEHQIHGICARGRRRP